MPPSSLPSGPAFPLPADARRIRGLLPPNCRPMSSPRIGIWFIGARGGVAATATLGLARACKSGSPTASGWSALCRNSPASISRRGTSFVVGGHEIREGTLAESLERLRTDSRVFDAAIVDACRDELAAIDARIRPGTLANCGATIGGLAGPAMRNFAAEPAAATVERLQARSAGVSDSRRSVERVVVVNLASTEPADDESEAAAAVGRAGEVHYR